MFRQTTLFAAAALVLAAACSDQQLSAPHRTPNARASFDGVDGGLESPAALDTLRGFITWYLDDNRQGDAQMRTADGDFIALVGQDAITLDKSPGQEVWVVGHFVRGVFYLDGYELRGDGAPPCGNPTLRDALRLPQLCVTPDSVAAMGRKPE